VSPGNIRDMEGHEGAIESKKKDYKKSHLFRVRYKSLLQKIFCEAFWNFFRRWAVLSTASINDWINRDCHFLLTEAVNLKSINQGGQF
jgi:hypothetical protein